MRIRLATLAILAHVGLISATDVCAQQAKSDPTPNCNAIQLPGLHDIVQGGKPYTITWGNNTGQFVSLVLCQGPASDILEIGCIVDHTPNTGSFVWIPAIDLVPDGNHNYGLKIIADTDDFQWSDQFGISNSISTSLSTPAKAPTSSAKAVKESAKAVKESAKAVSITTGTAEPTMHRTKSISKTNIASATGESKTHSKDHTHSKDYTYSDEHTHVVNRSATDKHLSAHLNHPIGANATHILKHQKSHILPSVIATPVTESVTPTATLSVPTTLPPTAGSSSSSVTPPSSVKTVFSAGGAARAVATGVPLVLGAMAALVL